MTPEKEIDGELWIRADYHHGAVGAAENDWRNRYDAIKREADYWRQRHDAVLDMVVKGTLLMAPPQPMMLADPESYELGKLHGAAAEREACEKACERVGQHNLINLCIAAIRARGQA